MKKKNIFDALEISEERKSKMFIGDRFASVSSEDAARYDDIVESPEYAIAYKKLAERVLPAIDIREPSSWAVYGSAEKYYQNAFNYIHNSYPYDGSSLEKINWALSASTVDLAVLQHEYPLEVGHIGFSTASWGSLSGAKSGIYGLSNNPEYVKFSGGPYVGTVLDSSTKRESSLKIDPSIGNTIEFWLRKNSFIDSSKTESEIVFDSHTVDFAEGTSAYGRFLLELSASSGSPFYVTYMSGTAGADRQQIGQNLTTASVADGNFHHYAVTAYHTGSNLELELYVDGEFNHKVTVAAASMGSVNGYFNASLGALRTEKDGTGGLGYGKLSGSMDEFRFWKTKRTGEEIANYFDFPVNGATDEEKINSNLGVYFKFNEGITGKTNDDKVVLDYSGRLNNGEIVGYVSGFRSSQSAITLSSVSTQIETGDPNINSSSPRVTTSLNTLLSIGRAWDEQNHTSLFKSVPQWAYDAQAGSSNLDSDFSILLQAIAQKFDSIKMLIDGVPKIGFTQYKDYVYAKGTVNYNANFYSVLGCEKDFDISYRQMFGEENFSVQNLLGRGFTIEDTPITSRADLNEYFYNLKFGIADAKTSLSEAFIQSKVENTKNKILNAIYANLANIYKTKGTYESFRNLIRCFGVDENLVSLNVYGQNVEKIVTNTPIYEAARIKSMAFTGSNNSMTLFQTASSSSERQYVEGKSSPASITVESKVLFPYILNTNSTAITASVFGSNEVSGSGLEVTGQNYSGFRVATIKSNLQNNGCYFRLSSSAGIFDTLTTGYFSEVYANTPWYLAVKFTEDTGTPLLNSDNKSTQDYKVEFIGYRYDIDVNTLQFHLTASITESDYQNFMTGNKSFFLGANRQNITGSLVNIADSKFLSFSVWDDNLSEEDMRQHAQSLTNIGRKTPLVRKIDNQGQSRLQSDTLVMNWQFDNVQELDSNTSYVYDHASGSTGNVAGYGSIVGYKYPAVTYNLQNQEGAVQQEFIPNVKYLMLDNLASDSKISIKDREIDIFELDSRPVTYLHSYEKSMYQVISKEMLNMLAGIASYNNLIGEPVYKYRQEYKSLEKLRERFFSRVENDIELEKFIEYYKWIDSSLAALLQQLQPATADMNLGLQDVVESHALERSKYKHQAPQFEYKDPNLVGQILGINELLYDWEHGHAPQPVFWGAFDGTNDLIDIPDSDDLSFGDSATDSPFSLSAWVVFTDPASSVQAVAGKFNGNVASEYLLFNNNGKLQANIYDLTSTNRIQTQTNSVVFEDGKLYHIAMTYDGLGVASGITVYVNGVAVSQTRSTNGVYTAMHNTSTNFQIGSTVFGAFDFARNMHHVMVFDAELTSNEVSDIYGLYNNGILNLNSSNFAAFANIVSWWKMDQKDYTTGIANDSKGSNDGTYSDNAYVAKEYLRFRKEDINCLWWNDRAERDGIIATSDSAADADREDLRQRRNTDVSGSTYVLRKLSRPYKFSADQQRVLSIGSNRKANKNKALHRTIVATGQEIQINSSDIYEFKKCNDVLDPQAEKIYTAKTDTTATEGYLDADADMILPFSLYSSSVGTDFASFKRNLQITNNHDDDIGIIQSPYLREIAGGMPHRRVKFGTPDAERPEAYILSASSTTLTLKQHTGPKSYTPRGSGVASGYSIRNIKTNTSVSPVILGNYTKDYDIVMTNGRSINNSYLVESGSITITPVAVGYVFGMPDYTSPVRGRAEHIIVNQFSSPGGPETQGVYGRDKESGEYSIYNTLNYRNLNVREPLNELSAERSEQFGYRSGSATQGSIHKVNRNFFYSVVSGTYGKQERPDNQFVQHPIPQNDFGYSWITASAVNTKFEFVEANDGFGHQHMFNSSSAKAIQFISASLVGSQYFSSTYFLGVSSTDVLVFSPYSENKRYGFGSEKGTLPFVGVHTFGGFIPVDFVGLNTTIVDQVNANTNTIGSDLSITTGLVSGYGGEVSADVNYINSDMNIVSRTVVDGARLGNALNYGVTVLNSIILNRQGPYGWPTWKQIRGGEHPIARAHRRTNTFSRVFLGNPSIGTGSIIQSQRTPSMNISTLSRPSILDAYERARSLDEKGFSGNSRLVKNYIDPVVTNRYSPIRLTTHGGNEKPADGQTKEYILGSNPMLPQYFVKKRTNHPLLNQTLRESAWFMDGYYYNQLSIPYSKVTTYKEVFQNDLTTFANQQIIRDIKYKERDFHSSLEVFSNLINQNEANSNSLLEMSYIETIYPREVNVYTENARERINFDYFPWNSTRSNRDILLSGNVNHTTTNTLLSIPNLRAFSKYTSANIDDYKKSFFGTFDVVRMGLNSGDSISLQIKNHISASTWVLDSRNDFATRPTDITISYFNDGTGFLSSSIDTQGTRAEGILQNDFSTFPLGYNNLYGTPPFSMVYNRRIPQASGSAEYLAGEAKWQAADSTRGPFYDSYNDYIDEIKLIGQDHSLVPEFRISEFTEKILTEQVSYPDIGNDFLSLTGAIYPNSSGDISIGGNFFKTYSNSDFLRYFSLYDKEIIGDKEDPESNISHARITFKCKAAMKFLPYKGFYPAERAVEIAELFQKHYLSSSVIDAAPLSNLAETGLSAEDARRYANLRANASRYQASKPLFGPGVLYNSIKAGLAVDYPVFYGDFSNAYINMPTSSALTDFSTLSIPNNTAFTGSLINTTQDAGIPRIKSYTTSRIQFEDLMSPSNLFNLRVYDNEPHPSASLLYGTDHWHRIIERPSRFGAFDVNDAQTRLGIVLKNTKEAFSRQISPYTLAMQNFAAETVNFFVEDGHLTTAISKPIKERFVSGSTYKMRVRLTNVDTVMYDRHSAFGPPVDDGNDGVDVTTYSPGATGSAAAMDFTFTNWETFNIADATAFKNIATEDANNILPSISFKGEGESVGTITFYYSNTYTPTIPSNPKFIYIDLKDVSDLGSAVAEEFQTRFTASAAQVPGWQLDIDRDSADITMTSQLIGVKQNLTWTWNTWKSSGTEYDWEGVFISGAVGTVNFSSGSDADPSVWLTSSAISKTEHGHMPYVPPFLDPGASPYVDITFSPGETKEFGAKEIIESCTFEYYNFNKAPTSGSNPTTTTNYTHAMSLSASLNLGLCVSLRTDNIEAISDKDRELGKDANRFSIDQNDKLSRWVIQSKWETPILDFTNVTVDALSLSSNSVTEVSGSPWKTKYWDTYYDRGRTRSNSTSGIFLTASTGMWHQKGEILSNRSSKGYFLQIEDITGSFGLPGLAQKLGFNLENEDSAVSLKRAKRYRNRVGLVEDKKIVKEAIVAIPYVVREDAGNRIEFIRFNEEYYSQALENVENIKKDIANRPLTDEIRTIQQYRQFLKNKDKETKEYNSDAPVDAIEYQLFMMDEYILPPQLDFTRTTRQRQSDGAAQKPFMMYFFQFHASFDQEDLSNIWQNLYPKSADSTASPRYSYPNQNLVGRLRPFKDTSYVGHYLETADLSGTSLCPGDDPRALFSPLDENNKTRWLIFKVKQRGESSLEVIRKRSIDPRERNVEKLEYLAGSKTSMNKETLPTNLPGIREDGTLDLQYNWPYDYFSFVELIKLETKIDSFNYQD